MAVVLAAGLSTRFGGDKLLHPLAGQPLGAHIATTLSRLPFVARIAVCPANSPRRKLFPGFDVIENPTPEQGMGASLALGVGRAIELDADAILICLADMPFVTRAHLEALLAVEAPAVTTEHDGTRSPPAVLGRELFPALASLTGDQGARDLLRTAATVSADAAMMRDFDTLSDFL